MSYLRWEDVAGWFGPEMGQLPDGHVADTSVDDWQSVLDVIRSAEWRHEYVTEDAAPAPPPAADTMMGVPGAVLRVWPVAGMQVNFWPFGEDRIDFDLDAREIGGQDDLDSLCGFLRTIGTRLGKPVVLTEEGSEIPAFVYEPSLDRVVKTTY